MIAMDMNRRALLLTSAALAANVVAPEAAFAQEQPRRGGIMTVHFPTEQRILNPSLQASTGVYIVGGKIQEPLVDLDAAGNPAPCLAESWEATPDGKTITFKLRQGVTWHDGKPFTSADVQFTAMEMWKKILNYGSTLQLFLDAVDTPDAHTAIFRYSRPMPLNLLLRALPDLGYVSAKHVYEGTDIRQNPANTAPMGTGPFRFVQYERGQFIIADRNPNYWRNNLPYLDRVVWRVVTDRSAAAAQMESGQLLFSPFSALSIADFTRLGRDPRFEVTTRGNEGNARTNTLEFNLHRKLLGHLRQGWNGAHSHHLARFLPGEYAAIPFQPRPGEPPAGRGRPSPWCGRRALHSAPDARPLGGRYRALVHLHPAIAE